MLKRWHRFVRFIEDGRVCLTNNAAERVLRKFALGKKSWLFAGSERGAEAVTLRPFTVSRHASEALKRVCRPKVERITFASAFGRRQIGRF